MYGLVLRGRGCFGLFVSGQELRRLPTFSSQIAGVLRRLRDEAQMLVRHSPVGASLLTEQETPVVLRSRVARTATVGLQELPGVSCLA